MNGHAWLRCTAQGAPYLSVCAWCRERASSMYAVLPFALATGFVEVPYLILQAVIFVPVRISPCGVGAARCCACGITTLENPRL